MDGMIEVTGVDLRELVKGAYALSRPVGIGFLHYKDGELDDATVDEIVRSEGRSAVSMDYVYGRQCKFHVTRDEDGRLWTNSSWYDHTSSDLRALLKRVGIEKAA